MGGQFFSDEGRNLCPVDLLHDLSRGTSFVSHYTNLPYHLLNPSRRTHIIASFLKAAFGRLQPVATGCNRPIADKRWGSDTPPTSEVEEAGAFRRQFVNHDDGGGKTSSCKQFFA